MVLSRGDLNGGTWPLRKRTTSFGKEQRICAPQYEIANALAAPQAAARARRIRPGFCGTSGFCRGKTDKISRATTELTKTRSLYQTDRESSKEFFCPPSSRVPVWR